MRPSSGCGPGTSTEKRRLAARAGKIQDEGYEDRSSAYQEMVRLVLAAQREALLGMRRDGKFSNETMNRIGRELDLEESRLRPEGNPGRPQG
jgi:monovalent cation/hydrogen antiporter